MAENVTKSLGQMKLGKPSDYNGTVKGLSTVFGMSIKPKSIAYRYDVLIVKKPADPKKKEKELTKQNDPGMRSAQKECCSDIIDALHSKTRGFGVDAKFHYDGRKTLFCSKSINLPRSTITLPATDLIQRAAIFVRSEPVIVTITPNERAPMLDYSDLKSGLVDDVTEQADRSARMFLEILTSQFLINSNTYQRISSGCLFEKQTRELTEGIQMRVGFKKGVKIGGDVNNPTALLVVDMKRTAFYSQKRVSDIYNEFVRGPNDFGGKKRFEFHMRDVRCFISYDPSRTFLFNCLTRNPIEDRAYYVNGKSIKQFMLEQKNIELKCEGMPGAHPNQPGGNRVVYPLEVIEVLAGQLVPKEKLSSRASSKLLLENSVSAAERYNYVCQQVKMIATGPAANFLDQFGVKIDVNSNSVDIHQRNLPKILAGGNHKIIPRENGSWFNEAKSMKFYQASDKFRSWKWAVFYDGVHVNNVQNYVNQLLKIAAESGMTVDKPSEVCNVPLNQLEAAFERVADKYQFVFYIDDERNQSHHRLKLYEAYYKVLTQHVITKNLSSGPQTLKNVIMKTNTKSFGICFIPEIGNDMKKFSLEENDLLIIGLDVAHPQQLSPKDKFNLKNIDKELENKHPSVVGICANKMDQRWGMAGDFFFQQSRREAISPARLRIAVEQIVKQLKESKRRPPARVIVVRDGLSEGQQEMAAREELDAIRLGIKDVAKNLDPKITFIVATKDHSKRFFRNNGGISNTCPGDIVDSKVVREDVPEVYVQNHHPLKGVPKMLQLSILENQLEMSMSEIQKLMATLSNLHQISACPTSLPLPVYCAHECAKRGFNIYNELYSLRFPNNRHQQPSPFSQKFKATDGIFDFDDLTGQLGYFGSALSKTRFNA